MQAASTGGTLVVTTSVEEGKPMLKENLLQFMKIPLTVLPLAEKAASTPEEPRPGDTKEGLKNLMTMSLTAVPDSSKVLKKEKEEEVFLPRISSDTKKEYPILTTLPLDSTKRDDQTPQKENKPPLSPLLKSKVKRKKATKNNEKDKAEIFPPPPPPSIVVDVSEDNESPQPPPKKVTIFELLLQKKKLIKNMAPSFVFPSEEDISDQFSIIDLYSRRIFPSLFFFSTSIYWILFNYYITDDFPDDGIRPSDGLIVTPRL